MDHKIIKFKNPKAKIHESAYIAEGEVIAADAITENANIWFNIAIEIFLHEINPFFIDLQKSNLIEYSKTIA